VSVAILREAGRFAARVRDQGPGIPPARREEALGRFTRLGDDAREGSGLGLSIVARIAELHGAPLSLGEGPGDRGLEATLRFPAA
jgi:signal transduction histidine kinase